jgi:hypothetical protein
MSPQLEQAVADEAAGHTVIWVGQPSRTTAFLWATPIWLIATPFTLIAVVWTLSAFHLTWQPSSHDAPDGFQYQRLMPLWGVPFLAAGFGLMASPFKAARAASKTVTVLTDQALILIWATRRGPPAFRRVPITHFISIDRTEFEDGRGKLSILTGQEPDSDGKMQDQIETITDIADVRDVELRLRAAMDQARR